MHTLSFVKFFICIIFFKKCFQTVFENNLDLISTIFEHSQCMYIYLFLTFTYTIVLMYYVYYNTCITMFIFKE